MRVPRLYLAGDLSGDYIELPTDRSHYLRRVLRLSDGAAIQIFDGHGCERRATLDGSAAKLGATLTPIAPPVSYTHLTLPTIYSV